MHHRLAQPVKPSHSLAFVVALALVGAVISLSSATTLPGKGSSISECYVTLEVEGTKTATDSSTLECQDGDPTCDQDGDCHNHSCTFSVQACPNQPGIAGCTSPGLQKLIAHAKSQQLPAPSSLTGSACGAMIDVAVGLKKKGKKAGKTKVVLVAKATSGKPKVDKDKDKLICTPSSIPAGQPCPAATTTTTVVTGSTTTTTICTSCPCACGTPDPTKLTFTTGVASGNCGSVQLNTGSTFKMLSCGGLYFGGGSNSVPLPSVVPDMGASITKVSACSGSTLTFAATAPGGAEGATMRSCTQSGCLFGPPLPIPNTSSTPTSTCVVNTVSADATGSADCSTGVSNINLPLNSEIFLTGDLLAARPGIQTCPVCLTNACTGGSNDGADCTGAPDCPSGTCATGTVCHAGPNEGMACTPADTALGTAGPTTHDCPPPTGLDIGGLPIGFVLSAGTITATAVAGTGGSAQSRVFCGYCRDAAITGSFENPADKCIDVTPGGPGSGTCPSGFPACEQNNQGAFGPAGGGAQTITEMGSVGGDLTDHAPHSSTLVSVFCIPPTFNPTVDAAANLPGPGSVSLAGQAQLE